MLISNHVLCLSPPIRESQTMDSRIGYSAAAHIGLLEWQTRLMLPFDIEVGVSDGEPFPASRHRTRWQWLAGPDGPARAPVLADISATLAA